MDIRSCRNCGQIVNEQAKFCPRCGGSNFMYSDNNETQLLNEEPFGGASVYGQPMRNQPYNPQNAAPMPTPKKKGIQWWQILLIVLLILIVAGCIIAGIALNSDDGDVTDNNDFNDSYTIDSDSQYVTEATEEATQAGVPYTKGAVTDGVYVNEWANIKMAIPEGFNDADSATYAAAENAITDCGAYFMAKDTMSLIYICYEKLPTFPAYTEEEYLDIALEVFEEMDEIILKEASETYSTTVIAGENYTTAKLVFDNGYGDFVQNVYVRKLDNYMVFICAISQAEDANTALVSTITTAE